jgi:phosphoglycolate phosphatase
MKTHYDVVSFDLDGTLVDTAGEIAEAANRALAAHGIARRPSDEIARLIGHGTRHLMLQLLARVFIENSSLADRVRVDNVLSTFELHYAAISGTRGKPYEGVHRALSRLRRAGLRLACVTNKEARHAQRVLQATRLDHHFHIVVGGDSLPQRKPHASVLRHVLDTLRGDPQRAAHVGDSGIDVETARNAGVAAWAVPYGYNGGVPIEHASPDLIFNGLQQLAEHVLK